MQRHFADEENNLNCYFLQ